MASNSVDNKHLFISDYTSGGGHKAACEALMKKAGLEKEDTEVKERVLDVMTDCLGRRFSEFCASKWNRAQKSGDIEKQKKLLKRQWIANLLIYFPVFFGTLKWLKKQNPPPEKIINTQAMGNAAILDAIYLYNRFFKPKGSNDVKMELWMTDLATKEANHFFTTLKKLHKREKACLILKVPQTAKNANLKEMEGKIEKLSGLKAGDKGQIQFVETKDLPIDPIYLDDAIENYAPGKGKVTVKLKIDEKQKERIQQNVSGFEVDKENQYTIPADDKVYSLMLGSQPTSETVKHFVKTMIHLRRYHSSDNPETVFLYCGKDEGEKESLFKEVCEMIKTEMDKVKQEKEKSSLDRLKLVPLPFQPPEEIAKTRARSNIAFSRAGGLTSFENLALHTNIGETNPTRVTCIVSEGKHYFGEEVSEDVLAGEIPLWEGGNAKELKSTIGARIVHPQKFNEVILEYKVLSDKKDSPSLDIDAAVKDVAKSLEYRKKAL